MAWERRGKGGQRYLYRSRRANGKIIHDYIGRGERAKHAIEEIEAEKARRLAKRTTIAVEIERAREADLLLIDLHQRCNALLEAVLLSAGFHRHNYGAWRRRRGFTID